jgi:hypothetical protein
MTTKSDLRATARRLHEAGMSVVKVRGDGTKRPYGRWEDAQSKRLAAGALSGMFPAGDETAAYGIGVVCGAVSGGLLMVEFEGAAVREGWIQRADAAMQAAGLVGAWERLAGGWSEYSPSGGVHMHVRVTGGECPGNLKLAQRTALPEELDARQRKILATDPERRWAKTMVETRGEGGFAVRAPSGGPVHPSGRAYAPLLGGPDTVQTLPVEAVEALLDVLRGLNVYEAPPAAAGRASRGELRKAERGEVGGGTSPFEDFNARGEWAEILEGVLEYTETRRDGVELWTRTGKDPRDGHSATIGYGAEGVLHVFSSSVSELPVGRSLNRAQAYTWLRFGNLDGQAYADAARELSAAGYGDSRLLPTAPAAARRAPAAAPPKAGTEAILARGVDLISRAPEGYAAVALRSACKGLMTVGTWEHAAPLVDAAVKHGVTRDEAVAVARKTFRI